MDDGYEFYFDKEDYGLISEYSWWKDRDGYICATIRVDTNIYKNIKMHRIVMKAKDNEIVDHIYHHVNDNRKSQLRNTTRQNNQRNQTINKANKSGKTGVCWSKKKNKWRAYITISNIQKSLGYYEDKNEAVEARLKAEKVYFGEYAYKGGATG